MKFFNILFGTFENILYLPFLLILIFITVIRLNKIVYSVSNLAPVNFNDVILNFSYKRNFFKIILLILGSLFLFFSLLSPQWNSRTENIQQEGRDIYIALDISKSMLAQDFSPNRLEWAKIKIKKLLNKLSTDRIGLILFSGSAFVQCPLTHDLSSFLSYLEQVDTEIISTGTTSIENAIKIALNKFSGVNKKNKLLVIFTDGEDFSNNLLEVKKEVANQKLNIFTLGVGTVQGAPIPLYDKQGSKIGHQLDENGKIVISKLNKEILNSLSENSGGNFIQTTENDEDLNKIMSKIIKFEKEKYADKKLSYLEEQYPYFLIISFICFALEWIL